MEMDKTLIFIGNILHCNKPFTVHTLEKGFLIVQNGKILAMDYESELDNYKSKFDINIFEEKVLRDTQILIPGLIDTHIHASQYPNIGLGLDKPLLEWLETYTYPLEKRYKDSHFSQKVYEAIVKKTLSYGTTTACYFATLYTDTTLLLVDSAIKYGQRAFVGKVNMTRDAPGDYLENDEELVTNTRKFIQGVLNKNSDLVKPIVTPRFPLSLSAKNLADLGKIAKEYNLNIQSHICENKDEIEVVEERFKMSYAKVYDNANLLTEKTILAHGVFLTDSDMCLLACKGTSISHCPSSNTFLNSGLCDVRRLVHGGVTVGLGSDVSGGNTCSIMNIMQNALQVSLHLTLLDPCYDHEALNCYDVFYLATLGGAQALSLDKVTGNFDVGKDFDALIVDMDVPDGTNDFLHECTPLELLQKFIYTGDDRNILEVYVAGRKVK